MSSTEAFAKKFLKENTMNILEVINLNFIYSDGNRALNDLSFSLKKYEIAALVGANGSGKTTLFQNLNGLLKPSSGEVLIKGENINKIKDKDLYKKVGLVFQNPDDQLFAPTVFEDISYGLINMGIDKKKIKERVCEALDLLKITHLAHKPIQNISFGQKKKVAIAGIICLSPDLLILDEPTAGLDPKGKDDLIEIINQIRSNRKISVLVSTHSVDIAYSWVDKVLIINSGKIVSEGPPQKTFTDSKILKETSLKQPIIIDIFKKLVDNNFIVDGQEYPKNIDELVDIIINNK